MNQVTALLKQHKNLFTEREIKIATITSEVSEEAHDAFLRVLKMKISERLQVTEDKK